MLFSDVKDTVSSASDIPLAMVAGPLPVPATSGEAGMCSCHWWGRRAERWLTLSSASGLLV